MTSSLRLFVPALATVALMGCQFSMNAGGKPQNQSNAANNGGGSTSTPTEANNNGGGDTAAQPKFTARVGKIRTPSPAALSSLRAEILKRRGSGTTPPTTTDPNEPRFVTAATAFGGPEANDNSLVGLIYFNQPGATKLPSFDGLNPAGVLFTNTLNAAPTASFNGFPGVDNRKDDFALRYEGPLKVAKDGDFTIRIVSDDGAKLYIDDMLIVDNDGVKDGPAEASGPVRLVAATHSLRIDYFHTTGPVALQVFVKPEGSAEVPLGTSL